MKRIVLSGCNGRMGRVVTEICKSEPELTVVAGFDTTGEKLSDYPVYAHPLEFTGACDCVIDFSSPAALSDLLAFCKKQNCGVVLATTGYSEEQLAEIQAASREIAIFRSANMSLGINVLMQLVRQAAQILQGYDIEIVERHHNKKLDAPSGTALMLADAAANAVDYDAEYIYERQSVRKQRDPHEIGISSVRGGTIVGEHEVIFAGRDEVIEIKHSAASREVFANGAVRAAAFLSGKAPGMYDMSSLIAEEN
jgi:4-hydroxy-tetrahydrodipicolinate reductase